MEIIDKADEEKKDIDEDVYKRQLFTLVVEEAILAVFITWLGFNSMAVKLIAQVVVIVLNYIISKLIVFKK